MTIWFPTTKSQESPQFSCMHVTCDISFEKSWWNIQLCFRPHFNQRFTCKIISPQSRKSPRCGKWHLDTNPMARHRVYYKGEGGDFPQVWAVMNFARLCLLMVRLCTKMFQLHTNQLIIWFVQVYVSNWCFSFFLVPIPEFHHAPLPPQSATSQGACPNFLFFHCFCLRLTFECIKELRNTSTTLPWSLMDMYITSWRSWRIPPHTSTSLIFSVPHKRHALKICQQQRKMGTLSIPYTTLIGTHMQ